VKFDKLVDKIFSILTHNYVSISGVSSIDYIMNNSFSETITYESPRGIIEIRVLWKNETN